MSEHGTFHWNELMTNDVDGAKTFYAAALGWTFDEFPGEGFTYWVCMAGDRPAGGIMPLEGTAPEGAGPHWFSYITVDDVDARVEAVKAAGGTVVRGSLRCSDGRPHRNNSRHHRSRHRDHYTGGELRNFEAADASTA